MGHQDRGHYAKKHPGRSLDPAICEKIRPAAKNGILACAAAHRLAKALGCAPAEIGVQADLLELRIARCQLGLFGFTNGEKKLNPDVIISDQLKSDILNTQKKGRIPCIQCWEIAKAHRISRTDMASACEKLEIRIKPCQIGAF